MSFTIIIDPSVVMATKKDIENLQLKIEECKVIVDSELSTESENPVQNKAVYGAVDNLSKMHKVFYNGGNGIPELGISSTSTLKELCEAMVSYKNTNGIRYLQTLSWINQNSTIGTDVQEALGTNNTFGILEASCTNNDVYLTYRTYTGGTPAPLAICVYTKTNNMNKFSGWQLINQVTIDSALSASSENPIQNKAVKAAIDAKGAPVLIQETAPSDTSALWVW